MVLNVANAAGGVRSSLDQSAGFRLHGTLARSKPIPPGATRRGWANFPLETALVPALNSRLASVSFFPADAASQKLPQLGNIRLWVPATPQGAAAVHVRPVALGVRTR
jgi:hypothetical protein